MSQSLERRDMPVTRGLGGGRPEASLMLSLGEAPTETRRFPRRLDFFRPKPGSEGQWRDEARRFAEFYGVTYKNGEAQSGPTELPVRFPGRTVSDVLDIRFLAFGQGRLAARGTRNYASCPELYGAPEDVDVYPLDGDPERVRISGPDDAFCLGGVAPLDVPASTDGKPVLRIVTTLTFILAEISSFTTPCAISTSSLRTTERLRQKLRMVEATGAMPSWLMRLRVKPVRTAYRDEKGKRHTSVMPQLDLDGPLHSLTDPTPMTLDEVTERLDTLASRGLLLTPEQAHAQVAPPQSPSMTRVEASHGHADQAAIGAAAPDGEEPLEGEIMPAGDLAIPVFTDE